MDKLRRKIGASFPTALTSFPYVDYHPALPYSVFLGPGGARYNLPQLYWHTIGVTVGEGYEHTFRFNRVYRRAIYPLGQTYDNPPIRQIRRFRRMAISYDFGGVSWWSWQETNRREWRALGRDVDGGVSGAGRSGSGYPVLSKGSRGDLVVWAQEHLKGAGEPVPVTGYFGDKTAARGEDASSAPRATSATASIGAQTWRALLDVKPRMVDWSSRRSRRRREAPGAPRAALGLAAGAALRDPAPVRALDPGRRAHRLRSSRRPIVARIENYSPGRVVIDGVELNRDVIVLPNRVLRNWWRRDGHSLVIEDLEDVLDELPERLIVGCGYSSRLEPDPSVIEALAEARSEGRGAADGGRRRPLRGARDPKPGGRRGGASPDLLIATLAALAVALAAPAPAAANENFADEPPFGGELPPPLVRPPSERRPPAGFELSAREAIRIADGAEAVRDERAESPRDAAGRLRARRRLAGELLHRLRARAAPRSPRRSSTTETGRVLGAWHDHQLDAPLARGYSGAIAQKVNAPYVWLPLCLLFLVPFFDPRRPFRLLHLDLLVLLGLGVSLLFFNRGEITASVPLTYPVLGYVFARMLWVGIAPARARRARWSRCSRCSWLAVGAVAARLRRGSPSTSPTRR